MLRKLLRHTEWKQLSAFASPAFLDVVSVRELYATAREVRTSVRDDRYRRAVESRAKSLRDLPLAIELPNGDAAVTDSLGEGATADANRVVTLYFHQLFSSGPTLIDLRREAFGSKVDELRWSPAPWVCDWHEDFLGPLREIYLGFYRDDDPLFMSGLEALNLAHTADLFRKHFGEDQRDQEFVMTDFIDTFHRVFLRCRDEGVRLHRDFLPLGVYLASLYDYMDNQAVRVDVRACFERATESFQTSRAPVTQEARTHE